MRDSVRTRGVMPDVDRFDEGVPPTTTAMGEWGTGGSSPRGGGLRLGFCEYVRYGMSNDDFVADRGTGGRSKEDLVADGGTGGKAKEDLNAVAGTGGNVNEDFVAGADGGRRAGRRAIREAMGVA